MAVPNTTTFTLQDVVTEVVPTTNDLVDCFADANLAYFDPNYYVDGNDLLEFRNYCSSTATCATQIFCHFYNVFAYPQNVCIQTTNQGRYVNQGATLATAVVLFQDSTTKVFASSGWHESSGNARYWNGSSFTSSATCLSWANILPSSGDSVLYSACSQSLGATKRYFTGGLGTNTQLYSDAGYVTWTTSTNFYYRYATSGNTNGTGSYIRVSNTTGLVSTVGACPASTTTTTTTTVAYNTVQISSAADADEIVACGLTLNLTKYYSGIIGNGTVLYDDTSLTTVYTGAAKFFHKIGSAWYGNIGVANGTINSYAACP